MTDDPRVPSFEEEVARLERMNTFRQRVDQDLRTSNELARKLEIVIRNIKGDADRRSFSSHAKAVDRDWKRIARIQLMSTWLVRQLAMTIDAPELRTYLYATQYLFEAEGYVVFLIDVTSYLVQHMRTGESQPWQEYRQSSSRTAIYSKIQKLNRDRIDCFSNLFDRKFRNALAHSNFEIKSSGTFEYWMKNEQDRTVLTADDLVRKFDNLVDLRELISLLFQTCSSERFLRAN